MLNKLLNIWNQQKLLIRLTSIILMVIIITILVMFFSMTTLFQKNYEKSFREDLVAIARQVSRDPMVVSSIKETKSSPELLEYESFMEDNYDLDYLVVFTSDRTRLTHPNRSLIYKAYIGNDDFWDALKGKTYSTIGNGTMGISVRAYAPIIDPASQKVIGAVGLGTMMDNYQTRIYEARLPFTISLIVSSVIGFLLSAALAVLMKRQMHDMEPQQIGQVLEERNAMLNNIQDAVFVTHDGSIELMNDVAQQAFSVSEGEQLFQKIPVLSFFDDGKVKEKGETTIIEHQHRSYLVSVAPIYVRKTKMGMIYILRDMQELYSLTQQLYSTKIYAQLLAKQHHDYLNKLHVIYGLADSEQYDEMLNYLSEIIKPNQFKFEQIIFFVHSGEIAGTLLLAEKTYRELGKKLEIKILGEIPEITDSRIKNDWIKKMQQVDNLILKTDEDRIIFEVEYSQDGLFSQYTLENSLPNEIVNQLLLLEDVDVVESKENTLVIFDIKLGE